MSFELFGTVTSPFVRRVRVVALEKNIPFTLVDINTPEGQARMRATSPVWKVPTVRFDDGVVAWETRVIIEVLCKDGWGGMRAPPTQTAERVDEENVVNAIDEAVLANVRRFYLMKDNVQLDTAWYVKDYARAKNVMTWVEGRIREDKYVGAYGAGQGFGRAELALFTAVQWFRFRNMVDVTQWPKILAFENAWKDRPSLAATAPPTA